MITLLKKSSDPITNHYKKGKVIALNKHANDDVILLIEGTAINCLSATASTLSKLEKPTT